ncbi:helix-turn-helix transcriptional regulator [Paenibacillus sp. FSL H7-0703]|uniref:helix-turn-helix domain-containing protein n=1 Tax=Paenibacillus sp. FSL H7-0703 TaxID=2921438 RepID=UPI0030FBB7C3
MSIGQNIKTLRKQKKLTQVELAKKANMSRSYLADVEGNRYNPSLETLRSIADALGVSISVITDDEDVTISTERYKAARELPSILKVLTDNGGFFYEELREDIFLAIINSGLYMSPAYHQASKGDEYERFFNEYFNSEENHSNSEEVEFVEEFNKAYELRTIMAAFEQNGEDTQERFIKELKKVIEKHNITNPLPSSDVKEFVSKIDLTDEELLEQFTIAVDGKNLSEKQIQKIIAQVRLDREFDK